MRVARQDLQYAAGSSQLCADQIRGCEAAVHAMKRIFAFPSVDDILLVDATNAFNEPNRQVNLRNVNVEVICPVLAPILTNSYIDHRFNNVLHCILIAYSCITRHKLEKIVSSKRISSMRL